MNRRLRIVVADDERNMYEYLEELIPQLGHEVAAVARTGKELVEQCRAKKPDLVITDIKMPGLDGIDAARQLCNETVIPVILVSAFHDAELIERATADYILAYLIKPIKQAHLETAIAIVMRRFDEFQSLRQEAADLRKALEDRKVIERAKGILMRRAQLDEAEAFKRLQDMASTKNRKMIEIAHMILTTEEAFQSPSKP